MGGRREEPSLARAMQHHVTLHLVSKLRMPQWAQQRLTAVGIEPTPLRTGALSQRRRPLGQTVMLGRHLSQGINFEAGLQGAAGFAPSSAMARAPVCPLRKLDHHKAVRDMCVRPLLVGGMY